MENQPCLPRHLLSRRVQKPPALSFFIRAASPASRRVMMIGFVFCRRRRTFPPANDVDDGYRQLKALSTSFPGSAGRGVVSIQALLRFPPPSCGRSIPLIPRSLARGEVQSNSLNPVFFSGPETFGARSVQFGWRRHETPGRTQPRALRACLDGTPVRYSTFSLY